MKQKPSVIGLLGRQNHQREPFIDAFSEYVPDLIVYRIQDLVKAEVLELLEIDEIELRKNSVTYEGILWWWYQQYRKTLSKDGAAYWVNQVREDLTKLIAAGKTVIVPDIIGYNEFELVSELGTCVHVSRRGNWAAHPGDAYLSQTTWNEMLSDSGDLSVRNQVYGLLKKAGMVQ